MADINLERGSQWRIWDLHVHTPASYGGVFSDFITNAEKSVASVIGINDYCTLKGYEEIMKLGGIPGKVLFPVVELRMNNLLHTKHNQNGIKINFHVIFDNDPEIFPKISTWLQSLKCKDEKGDDAQLGTVKDVTKVDFDYDETIKSLKQLKLYDKHALVWLPYDEYGGIDEIDPKTSGFFKLSLINNAHIIGSSTSKQIQFFKWEDEKFRVEQYKEWFDKPKPCIKGSDAHKLTYPIGQLQNQFSQPTDKHCWINADMTFGGLKQIVIEPDRVFIGDEPDLLKRVRNNKTKFIQSLNVSKLAGTSLEDTWFDNLNLKFNSGLVAIIGNKGSGKSAITDIIGLCGNTHQEPSNFSFLISSKFRKLKPLNLSERFQATMTWEDNTSTSKRLNENPDKNLSERVKYIPQHFLERLCANIESDDFEKEIKQIIFSHTPTDKRLGKASLDELINYKSGLINEEIVSIQAEISKLNGLIINLEDKSTENYKKSISDKLLLKKNELQAHLTSKPVQPPPSGSVVEDEKLAGFSKLRDQITKLELEISELNLEKASLSLNNEELKRSLQYFQGIDEQLKKVISQDNVFSKTLTDNGISISDVISYEVNTTLISDAIANITTKINGIDADLDSTDVNSKSSKLYLLNEQLKNDQEELDKPAKAQQKYLDDLKEWELQHEKINGDPSKEDTLKYYENVLAYITSKLEIDLNNQYKLRDKQVDELFQKKNSLVEIRKELFQPVMQFISDFKELKKRYDVKIDVSLELRSFADNFFQHINQQRKGTFSGKEEGYKKLNEILERVDFSSAISFKDFANSIIDQLRFDKRSSNPDKMDLHGQLRAGSSLGELYDFIYNFNYLQPVYNLKLGAKTLQELSPGERGALLLIFYLILDKDDIPLIIDQPEENLDNESVYHILVHFIKKVKEKRQIIIVTHNPNLAIVCDADQIIYMNIEKNNKNSVTYYAGAIENAIMNKKIIDILEGTLPAFNNRDLKYIR